MTPIEVQKVVQDVSRSKSFQRGIEDMNTSRINEAADASNFEIEATKHKVSESNIFEESQQVYI